MTAILHDLGLWFWRLVPANPILVRVVYAGSRRSRHLAIRIGYLIVIAAIVVIGVFMTQTSAGSSLADLAKSATQIFKYVAIVQLAMVCLVAPTFAAGAITQEKDSQTFNILLTTPLSNAQIVFGSLLSRLYFVFVLLLGGLPLFCIMMVYGGVTFREIAMSAALAAASAFVAGALAITMSVVRVGTRKTILSFYVGIALYLMLVWALSTFPGLVPPESPTPLGGGQGTSWLSAFHPFLSLWVVLNMTPAPDFGAVAHYGTPWSYLLAYPAACYIAITGVLSVLLCVASLSFVRAGIKEGEPTLFNRLFGRGSGERTGSDERSRRARSVWNNAVAWREAMTRASGGGRAVQRIIVIVLGVLAAAILLYFYHGGLPATTTRWWLQSVIAIELGLSLLVATNTAATALTREKEAGTLEILLTTPMVSRDIIRGKMMGLWGFAIPMITVPFLSVLMFVLHDLLYTRKGGPVVHAESLITLPVLMLAFAWAACMVGLWFSISARKTVQAVIYSVGVLLGVCLLTSCSIAIGKSSAQFGAVVMPFSPIPAAMLAINPEQMLESGTAAPAIINSSRVISLVASFISAVVYAIVGFSVHKAMVRNFDMIIRRQTT